MTSMEFLRGSSYPLMTEKTMKYIKGGFFAGAIIGTCAVAILVFDWSPWNLVLGPQHSAFKKHPRQSN